MSSKALYIRPDGDYNIPRTVHDPHFRYHMNPLATQIESRGNGVKTCVSNLVAIAGSLDRDVQYLAKHISNELGVNCVHIKETGKWLFTGNHSMDTIALKIDSFIAAVVVCAKCQNPETIMSIENGKNITLDCKACGNLTSVHQKLRLFSFILKHPPVPKGDAQGDPALSEQFSALTVEDLDFAEHWSETPKDDSEEPLDPVDALSNFLLATPKPKKDAIVDRVKAMSLQYGWKRQAMLAAVFGALFGKDIVGRVKEHASTIGFFIRGETDQLRVLSLLEKACGADPTAAAKVNFLLQQFYEQDILEEAPILKWSKTLPRQFDQEVPKALREKAAPFLTWLTTADDDDDEDEEE